MKLFIFVLLSLCISNAVSKTWAPKPTGYKIKTSVLNKFHKSGQLELIIAKTLTASNQELLLQGKQTFSCGFKDGAVPWVNIVSILNGKHAGKTISEFQAITSIIKGLSEIYPCKPNPK